MMMQGLRNAGQTWLGKIIVGVLFSLLILSFAVWGIADIFRGYGRTTVATVGGTEIGVEQLRFTYQNELQRLIRQTRGQISADTARRLGLDRGVLQRMIAEAAVDERVRQLGLGISDETIASAIISDPRFKGPDGAFNRLMFEAAIRDANLNEPRFVAEQRKDYLRQHLTEGLVGGVEPPAALREAMHRVANETRTVDYVAVPADRFTPATPNDAALQKFFDENKASFRAPEYRSVNVLALTPTAIAKPETVSDDDARKRYDEVKTSRFGSPERRAIRQLRFANAEEAKAASDKIKAGVTFEAVAAERNIAEKDLDIGRLTRAEIVDAAVAEAAFALAKDAVSEPVNGQFGPALIKIVDIEAENVKPFADVAAEIKAEIARDRARQNIREVHDKIEDQRASAKPLGEIAQSLGLTMRGLDGVDAQGAGRDGAAIADIPERAQLLARAFASDVGADNEPISTADNGYVWFETVKVEPARDRTLAEVREQAIARFKDEDVTRQLTEKAAAIAKRIEGGETMAAVATAEGLGEPKTAAGLKRDAPAGDISRGAAAQIFNAPVGRVISAPAANGKDRLVLRVADAVSPPFVSTTQDAAQLDQRLRGQLGQDLMSTYVARVQSDIGVKINQEAVRLAIGGDTPQ